MCEQVTLVALYVNKLQQFPLSILLLTVTNMFKYPLMHHIYVLFNIHVFIHIWMHMDTYMFEQVYYMYRWGIYIDFLRR